ncbi:AI-2E family transporter [Agromyces sp. H3Y2-19a]|uniref:AI-2E family transporter n=1 Tax=Agromyces TaxID=33877 RepID=UPI001E52E63C|nr:MULTISPECIES: AI-2E family transporter [Agromyces]MCD5346569.1 AI-2E family transporter [Agromyces sp. S2-1-8]MDF0512929.1 AI-2E family transporter [Agromyces chromiiresistens]
MADSGGAGRGGRRARRWFGFGAAPEPAAKQVHEPASGDVESSVPYGVRLAGAWSWRLLLIAGVLAVVVFLVIQLRLILIPLLVAVLLSALLVPFSAFLRRHGWPKWLAVAVAMLSALAVVGGLLTLGIWQIVRGADELTAQSLVAWDDFRAWLLAGPLHITEAQLNDWVEQAVTAVQQDMGIIWSGALSLGSTVGHFLAGMLLALFATLFMLIDGRGIWNWIVGIFPRRARTAVDGAGQAGWETLQNFVRVQILVATIDAIGIGLGAFFLGLPLAIPIAILVFLGSFIPIVGAVVTGALAVFVALVYSGFWPAVIMLGIVLLVQQIEGHVLQPLIMGTAVKVHPLGVVVAVATGSFLAGIPGALFAVPVAAVVNVMILYISSGDWKDDAPPSTVAVRSPLWRTVPQRPGFQRGE